MAVSFKLPNLIEMKRDSRNKINQIQWSTKQFNFLVGKENFDANVHINVAELKNRQDVLKNFKLDTVMIKNTVLLKR
ncbi:hypothetical protein GOM44_04050 [Wolbachia endosymbiont of Atemnus politus]|uniref:hypothetical protein n=1 Tax=Wolbachia endosymbiont of Atemnus politus TaxID=2682840 RepID=UPI0015723B40|nr:hypothetical protein [Wolbachia endosymbiont of Atemnus politus]